MSNLEYSADVALPVMPIFPVEPFCRNVVKYC